MRRVSSAAVSELPVFRRLLTYQTLCGLLLLNSCQALGPVFDFPSQQAGLRLRVSYPSRFGIKAFSCGDAAYAKAVLTGPGISQPLIAQGADTRQMLPSTGCQLSATLPAIPFGKARVVTVALYDAQRRLLTGSTIETVLDVYLPQHVVEVSYRQTPAAQIAQSLAAGTSEQKFILGQVDFAALQTRLDTLMGVGGSYPNYTYTTAPQLLNIPALTQALTAAGGNVAALDLNEPAFKSGPGSVRFDLAGLRAGDSVVARLDDGLSQTLTLNNNGQAVLTGLPPGTWQLSLNGAGYAPLRTSVTVTASTQTDAGTLTLVTPPDQLVNSLTAGPQNNPALAQAPDGHFVATWFSIPTPGQPGSIQARVFNADGSEARAEFQVNTTALGTGSFVSPAVAINAAGEFVVSWTTTQNGAPEVRAQRFNADGSPKGGEILVYTFPAAQQFDTRPDVALDSSGNFVVTWYSVSAFTDREIYARRFDNTGNPSGAAIQVNTQTSGDQKEPAIEMDANGNYVISWISQDTTIAAQRFDSSGNRLGGELVLATASGDQILSENRLAMNAGGSFAAAWTAISASSTTGDYDVYARRFDSSATPLAPTFRVNNNPATQTQEQRSPAVAIDASGRLLISWTNGTNNLANIFAQRYNADGSVDSTEFQVNRTVFDVRTFSQLALDDQGGFLALWKGAVTGSNGDLFMQRYNAAGQPLLGVSP